MNGKKANKRKKRDRDEVSTIRRVSAEALRGVSAILLIAIAGFLGLASFGVGGVAGTLVYSWLSWLLGVGYMILPLSLVLLAVAILRSFEKHFGIAQVISMAIFLLSTL